MASLIVKYRDKYEDLSFREQALILLSIVVLSGLLWFIFVYEPLYLGTKSASSDLIPLKTNIDKLIEQKKRLEIRRDTDPNIEIKNRIAFVSSELDSLNKVLGDKFHGLITPKKMAQVLESVLKQQSSLKLLSVKSLLSEPLIKRIEKKDTTEDNEEVKNTKVEVFRHGLQIEFEGNYLAALKYLKTLESLEWEFYWDAVELEVTDYPKAHIIITVHTLSFNDYWIGV